MFIFLLQFFILPYCLYVHCHLEKKQVQYLMGFKIGDGDTFIVIECLFPYHKSCRHDFFHVSLTH